MPEISEGTKVITPEGKNTEVIRVLEPVKGVPVTEYQTKVGTYQEGELVKVDSPIRVRVSRQSEAEQLVALAEECGFSIKQTNSLSSGVILLKPDIKEYSTQHENDTVASSPDLTYEDDYKQIKAWIQHHAESEDECETCHGSTTGRIGPSHTQYDCPDCTDDYSEPRPEDEEFMDVFEEYLYEDDRASWTSDSWNEFHEFIRWYEHNIASNPDLADDVAGFLLDKIRDLEQELQDCWENQQEYKNDVAELQEKLNNIRDVVCDV